MRCSRPRLVATLRAHHHIRSISHISVCANSSPTSFSYNPCALSVGEMPRYGPCLAGQAARPRHQDRADGSLARNPRFRGWIKTDGSWGLRRAPARKGGEQPLPRGLLGRSGCRGGTERIGEEALSRFGLPVQWLIIHGRPRVERGCLSLAAVAAEEPQEQPGPWLCPPDLCAIFGAWALFSFTAWARRRAPSINASAGAVRMTRGDLPPHVGQGEAAFASAMGRKVSNGPHSRQRCS